jgi:hypothetical protein
MVESPQYPLYRKLGGPKSRPRRSGEENIFTRTGTQTPRLSRPACSYSLYRLGGPGFCRFAGALLTDSAMPSLSDLFVGDCRPVRSQPSRRLNFGMLFTYIFNRIFPAADQSAQSHRGQHRQIKSHISKWDSSPQSWHPSGRSSNCDG